MRNWKNIDHQALREMDGTQLDVLCADIRTKLIDSVSVTGGHLASNLGVVELTVALHRLFNTEYDRIVWDVGHQSYVHKMLTGRAERFGSLRKAGGLSGFPRRAESKHDAFDTGHSSTSLSAALGMAFARTVQGESDKNIIAVIGDGAMTGGMCYEALNQIGSSREKIVIILNDNAMSISPNVGALHYHLSKARSSPRYVCIKRWVQKRSPQVASFLERIKNSVKYMLTSSAFFEEMGIKYFGPIDGHNLDALEKILLRAKEFDSPVLVHVLTQKGKGYRPAEESPTRFHGLSPARSSGEASPTPQRSNSEIFADRLIELAKADPRIVAITAAMPTGTALHRFAAAFPSRFYDVGIAEQHAVTLAAGMAVGGLRPVFAVYSSFLQRAYDQLLHDVCLQKLPVVFAVDRAGLVGEDGSTHQGVFDIGYLRQMPGMTFFSPASQRELEEMLTMAFALEGPSAIRYPRQVLPSTTQDTPIQLGKWDLLSAQQTFHGVALVATGAMLGVARQTAQELGRNGMPVSVVNARFIKPLDEQMLRQMALQAHHIAVLEDGVSGGGMGEQIAEFLLEKGYKGAYRHFALPERPLSHGTPAEQLQWAGLDQKSLVREITRWMEKEHAGKKQA